MGRKKCYQLNVGEITLGNRAPDNTSQRDDLAHGQIKFTFSQRTAGNQCTTKSGEDVPHDAVQYVSCVFW